MGEWHASRHFQPASLAVQTDEESAGGCTCVTLCLDEPVREGTEGAIKGG